VSLVDWIIVAAYAAFAIAVGSIFARRAGKDLDEYFLSGRSLPWWVAGTSMVATTFAADTPLVVSGWVRESGIWRNWIWWCLAGGACLSVFLFARLWRRGGVMTTAELAELRYGATGAREAGFLRGLLGLHHSLFTNTITICWVLVAAKKILAVLLGVDAGLAVTIAATLALSYSLLAGFWGVVVTDLVQFLMAMVGSIALAWFAWAAVGGSEEVLAQVGVEGGIPAERLAIFPPAGEGGLFDAGFWTAPIAAVAVYLGLAWYANDGVDGGGPVVQRVAASRSPRDGSYAVLWYSVAHFALRPWPWIIVAIASLLVLPDLEVRSPIDGTVAAIEGREVVVEKIAADGGGTAVRLDLDVGADGAWRAETAANFEVGARVSAGDIIARSDPEKAYVVMLLRYLPAGLLGLAVASLLAAFMSTIDTHVNLASSFFVNDVYRRFLRREADPKHYVAVARLVGAGVMLIAGLFAVAADSISGLFTFFLSFLAGVGPIYVARWIWWRVRARTEIAAMIASGLTATALVVFNEGWSLGPLSPDGVLGYEGRIILVVATSLSVALAVTFLGARPDPASLVPFYEKVRPPGWWGPVAARARVAPRRGELAWSLIGTAASLLLVFGLLFTVGALIFGQTQRALVAGTVAVLGTFLVVTAARRIFASEDLSP
jgi:solute:Na+ symporter, SSS family